MTEHSGKRHQRRSIRLQRYDYTRPGAYFVTICTQHRECLFGDIVDEEMRLNDAGRMVQTVWDEIPSHYPNINTDAYAIMPNHIHAIIVLVGAGPRACPDTGPRACPDTGPRACPDHEQPSDHGHPRGGAPTVMPTVGLSLPDMVHRYKTMTTKRYTDGVKQAGWAPFPGKLWQRNYWEHVVRDDSEWNRIREYIVNNPAQWKQDQLNHHHCTGGS